MIDTKKILKSLGLIACVILLATILVKHTSNNETLLDYAERNPELAYATPKVSPDPSADDEAVAGISLGSTADDEAVADDMTDQKQATAAQNASGSDSEATLGNSATASADDSADSVGLTDVSLSSGNAEKSTSDTVLGTNTPLPEDSFYYTELTDEVRQRITGISYPLHESDIATTDILETSGAAVTDMMPDSEAESTASAPLNILPDTETIQISYDDLRYLKVLYYDFNGDVREGELICNRSIAEDLREIFYELYQNEYQIESIRLIDDFDGDDTASMEANNTSCFNYRVVDGTTSLSKHALGCAIDINPFYNPYIVFDKTGNGQDYISPVGSEIYADRSKAFPYKIDENDLCYKLFKEHGFTWGGNWNSCKDYQHFQKVD